VTYFLSFAALLLYHTFVALVVAALQRSCVRGCSGGGGGGGGVFAKSADAFCCVPSDDDVVAL